MLLLWVLPATFTDHASVSAHHCCHCCHAVTHAPPTAGGGLKIRDVPTHTRAAVAVAVQVSACSPIAAEDKQRLQCHRPCCYPPSFATLPRTQMACPAATMCSNVHHSSSSHRQPGTASLFVSLLLLCSMSSMSAGANPLGPVWKQTCTSNRFSLGHAPLCGITDYMFSEG